MIGGKRRAFALGGIALMLLAAYTLSVFVGQGIVTYGLSLIPLAIIFVTAIARVNDIGPEKSSTRWDVRRAGLSVVAAASIALMLVPLWGIEHFPSWKELALYVGIALTWLTTPAMPPWWNYITRGDQNAEDVGAD